MFTNFDSINCVSGKWFETACYERRVVFVVAIVSDVSVLVLTIAIVAIFAVLVLMETVRVDTTQENSDGKKGSRIREEL